MAIKNYRTVDEKFVNDGKCFFITYHAAVGGGLTGNLRFIVPATGQFHLVELKVYCDADATLIFEEGTTINVAGTGLTEFNRDRRSTTTRTATLLVEHTATLGAAGTVLFQQDIPAAAEVDIVKDAKFILKTGEEYVLKVTDIGGGHNLTVEAIWYEVS